MHLFASQFQYLPYNPLIMKYLSILLLAILTSCNECKEPIGPIIIDVGMDIFVENQQGENLLSPSTQGYIDWQTIKLFYQVGEDKVEVYDYNMDCPRNICFNDDEPNKEVIGVSPYYLTDEEYPVTYIQWTEFDTDTIKCHFKKKNKGAYTSCDQIWYNGEQVYPGTGAFGLDRAFKVVK